MDEQALIRAAQRGDLDAFNRLVIAYQGQAYNVSLRIMADPHLAADATQEAFLSAFRGLRRFRGGSFRAWMMRIVLNACYDELRRRRRRPAASLEAMSEKSDGAFWASPETSAADPALPEDEAERSELRRAIEDCLRALPLPFRTVAVLVDVQGYDYREASKVIGKPVGTVKSRLARARGRLRDCLAAKGELLPADLRLKSESI